MISITDYIKSYENILTPEICKKIIKEDGDSFEAAVVSDGTVSPYRNCHIKDLDEKFDSILFQSIAKIIKLYEKDFNHFTTGLGCEDTGYEHLWYKGGEKGEYKEHVDHYDLNPRVLSCSIILNDDYTGGDFSFFKGEYVVPKKTGSAVVFPSNFCFPHSITPVSEGDRHSIITWIR
jgi:predicted 2-oxoglutarate/Fe(II)-dependent dioxygenase YbiX